MFEGIASVKKTFNRAELNPMIMLEASISKNLIPCISEYVNLNLEV